VSLKFQLAKKVIFAGVIFLNLFNTVTAGIFNAAAGQKARSFAGAYQVCVRRKNHPEQVFGW
jgi:hypothetical protein